METGTFVLDASIANLQQNIVTLYLTTPTRTYSAASSVRLGIYGFSVERA